MDGLYDYEDGYVFWFGQRKFKIVGFIINR